MARRYDSHTTTFSPEGRLYQVEYAMEAISHAGAAVGIQSVEGVILAAEKKILSKLLETSVESEKMYQLDQHVAVAVAGINSDANILINSARIQHSGIPLDTENLFRWSSSFKAYVTRNKDIHSLVDYGHLGCPSSLLDGIDTMDFNYIRVTLRATTVVGRQQRSVRTVRLHSPS